MLDAAQLQHIAATAEQRLFGDEDPGYERYRILARLGEGSQGVVYRGHDRLLNRPVALKQVDVAGWRSRKRLLSEAMALARLSHPHVAGVFDFVETESGDFLVMELVDGDALRVWCAASPRSWRDVCEVFTQAGKGIEAAHAAGLVHRDIKPDNIVVPRVGPVRVIDFGVALFAAGTANTACELTGPIPVLAAGDDTDTSEVATTISSHDRAGTLRYMAPELRLGEGGADARTDIFSFCMSLWEALHGEAPALDLARRTCVLERRDPKVPTWLNTVAARGLAWDPDCRWSDMRQLVDALQRDLHARRQRRIWIGTALVACTGLGLLLGAWSRPHGVACPDEQATLAALWDPARREAVQDGFIGTGQPTYAEAVWTHVAPKLDQQARAYAGKVSEVCRATHESGIQSSAALDLRMACLDRRRTEFAALTAEFAAGSLVDRAYETVAALTPAAACDDLDALARSAPLPDDPAKRELIRTAYAEVDRLKMLRMAGEFDVSKSDTIVARARDLDHAPLLAEALAHRAAVQANAGDAHAASLTLHEALSLAEASRADEVAADAWLQRQYVDGYMLARVDQLAELETRAAAALGRGVGGPYANVRLIANRARRAAQEGDYATAVGTTVKALDEMEAALGADHPLQVPLLMSLSAYLLPLGRYDTAVDAADLAATIAARAYGPHHPDVAAAIENAGNAMWARGELEAAESRYKKALWIRERAFGADHPELARTFNNLSNVAASRGEHAAAERLVSRALDLLTRHRRDGTDEYAVTLGNRCNVLRDAAQLDAAQQDCTRSAELFERIYGGNHAYTAQGLYFLATLAADRGDHETSLLMARKAHRAIVYIMNENSVLATTVQESIGLSLWELGRRAEALAELREVLALRLAALGAQHPKTMRSHFSLGEALLKDGKIEEATPLLRVACDGYVADKRSPEQVGEVQFRLAQSLWAGGTTASRTEARDLARRAADSFAASEVGAEQRAEVLLWLHHPGAPPT